MNLKTYQAESMPKALAMVKQDLGNDAVILHTRTFKRGGVFGFGAKSVVEITASNNVNVRSRGEPRQQPAPAQSTQTRNANLLAKLYQDGFPVPIEKPQPTPVSAPFQSPPVQPRQDVSFANTQKLVAAEVPAVAVASTDKNVADELQEIKQLVHRMMQKQAQQTQPDLPQQLFDQYLSLLEQEVAEELAEDVVASVKDQLDGSDLKDASKVRLAIENEISSMIPIDASAMQTKTDDGRPLTLALIGPTGVGKTTTIAKLAATFKLKHQKKVGLITIDTYRIAAVEQLRTYANIIDVPLHVVMCREEMISALAKFSDCDVILIDTAGRSQRDSDKLKELKAYLEVAKPHEMHLVLSSTCSQPVLMEAVEKFSSLPIDHIIFTKLDEAVSFGVILNVLRRVDKALSYITTGQEVPHQIEVGRSDRLAELIMGSGV